MMMMMRKKKMYTQRLSLNYARHIWRDINECENYMGRCLSCQLKWNYTKSLLRPYYFPWLIKDFQGRV